MFLGELCSGIKVIKNYRKITFNVKFPQGGRKVEEIQPGGKGEVRSVEGYGFL